MNRKIITYVSLGVIFLLILAMFLVVPWAKRVFESNTNLSSERERLSSLKSKLTDLRNLNEFELEERRKIAFRAMPQGKTFMEVVAVLAKLAQDNGLFVENYRIAPGSVEAIKEGQLEYKIIIRGNLSSMSQYLKDIQTALPLMNPVGKLNVSWEEGAPVGTLTVETYFSPLPKSMGPLGASVPKLSTSEEKALTTLFNFTYLPPAEFSPVAGKSDPFSF